MPSTTARGSQADSVVERIGWSVRRTGYRRRTMVTGTMKDPGSVLLS